MAIRNRPAFMAIKTHSPDKPVLIFVSSRRQTRLTAQDLVNYCGMEENPKRFLHIDEDLLEEKLETVRDQNLRQALSFGIGLHHAGLTETDRKLVEELFVTNQIQVLVATSTLAWGVNFPAHLVIVKATEYFDAKIHAYKDMDLTDVLQMMGIAPLFVVKRRSCWSTRFRYKWCSAHFHGRFEEIVLQTLFTYRYAG
jgi:antiviral helicase SLH1